MLFILPCLQKRVSVIAEAKVVIDYPEMSG
jgi:hypothetical protein